ncbi:MAG: zf-HC2 domain-containing protein [Sedimentisphaerales bacterium]|nr:zf-HC2 domain-containing protein [Sedimentisphaerales bacterium]
MNCSEFANKLYAWLENLLDEAEKVEFEEHLKQCPDCQTLLEESRQLYERLLSRGTAFAGGNLPDKVMTTIKTKHRNLPPRPRSMNRIVKYSLACAASLVIGLIIVSIYVAQYHPDPQDTVIIGQNCLYANNPAGLRILVRNHTDNEPIENAEVRISLKGQTGTTDLGEYTTGKDGCLHNLINIPDVPAGKYTLIVKTQSKVGKDHIERQIEIKRPYRLYLTTDKPVYQPCQTLHMRALALNRVSLNPYAQQKLTFEIEDPKGNKVHKVETQTSDFGIASADFDIAREVNLGRYRVRAVIGDVESEKIVSVKHYVLPKFKINVTTNKPYYLPAEILEGTIKADYFFGKPVSDARVYITGRTMMEKPTDIFKLTGKTDAGGEFTFSTQLSDYFTGMPLAGGNAFLQIEVKVKDTAGHEETTLQDLVVASQPINIHVMPESGEVVPGVENIIYIMCAYPDGQPALCRVNVNGSVLQTDSNGIAVYTTVPHTETLSLEITATDDASRRGSLTREISSSPWKQGFLLRTDKAVYTSGQTVQATILSVNPQATFFLDIIKDSQTMLTKTVPVENGRGELLLDLPPGIFGTLKLCAYTITSDGQSRADSRIIHVHQVNQLDINTSLDQDVYRPGESAHINFQVTDPQGNPTPAALSLTAVDEAVFYVSENRPGLLEQFFLTDEELLKPAYQIKFAISPAKLLSGQEKNQNLAQALFASSNQITKDTLRLKDLVGYLEEGFIEYLNEKLEDGRYDEILNDPQYAHLRDIILPETDYTLRTGTFNEKLSQILDFRKSYFNILNISLIILISITLFVAYIYVIYYNFCIIFSKARDLSPIPIEVYRAAKGLTFSAILLFVIPFITYFLAMVMTDEILSLSSVGDEIVMWITFGFNAALASFLVIRQIKWSQTLVRFEEVSHLASKAMIVPIFFIIQYVATRTIIIIDYYASWSYSNYNWGYYDYNEIAIVATVLSTFLVFVTATYIAKKIITVYMVKLKAPTLVEILVIIGIMSVIFSILMPSLGGVRMMAKISSSRSELYSVDIALQEFELEHSEKVQARKETASPSAPRIRKYFPETLLWRPELITDDQGRASLDLALADSITNWKMSVEAVSGAGRLGSREVDIRVFQDFFVDLDLPVALTRNDEISIPVQCYNYLNQSQRVKLDLQAGSWCGVLDSTVKEIDLQPNEVTSIMFRIEAREVGRHKLTLKAYGQKQSDAVQREITVRPDGTEIEYLQNELLTRYADHTFIMPAEAIPNSHSLVLRFYPSKFSEVVEGLDNIFRMPYGCFEQTSSTTYPNVMALQYMQQTQQITPEVEIKARKFITAGYQRLLTFEVDGGGFDWFGESPANEILTAYGILEFSDMARVLTIDPAVIDRAVDWLKSKQHSDGSWHPDRWAHSMELDGSDLLATAYIAWSLAEAGQSSPELENALNYLRRHIDQSSQTYTLALGANAFLAKNKKDPDGLNLLAELGSRFTVNDKTAYLTSAGSGAMYSRGQCLDIETTALGSLALMKAGRNPELVKKSLTWISQQKDQFGTWHSTQATILAMKALISGTGTALSTDTQANISVTVNDRPAGTINITPQTGDLVHSLSLTQYVEPGKNLIHIESDQDMEIPYRLAGSFWIPMQVEIAQEPQELEIHQAYDKTNLAVDDILTCTVEVIRNGKIPVEMAIIDLGIPPGFKVDPGAFENLVKAGVLAKYEITGNQCILYVRNILPGKPLKFSYQLKALYPLRAQPPPARVYEYYNPSNQATTLGGMIIVNPI